MLISPKGDFTLSVYLSGEIKHYCALLPAMSSWGLLGGIISPIEQEVAQDLVPAHHLASRLLQLTPGWCAYICHLTVFNLPKFSHTTPHSALNGCSNLIQDTGTCLPCCEWFRPILHPRHGQTTHHSLSMRLCYCQSAYQSHLSAYHYHF